MTTKYNEEITRNKLKNLLDSFHLLVIKYTDQADKKRNKMVTEDINNTENEIIAYLKSFFFIFAILANKLQSLKLAKTNIELIDYFNSHDPDSVALFGNLASPEHIALLDYLAQLDHVALLDKLKETIEKMDQRVREKFLPTRLDKIYETIKTLLRNLIALFVPLNEATQTLTSARSTLFSQIETLKKSLNPTISEPQTETPMIGLSQPRI